MHIRTYNRGFSFVEVIIVSALMVLVFGALFASVQYSLKLITLSRAKLSALSVGNDRIEYFRSLPYDDVGTVLGIPPGTIPQNSTTTLNGVVFAERVLVEYVDDPADGLNVSDTNGIPSDYKRVKLEYTWDVGGMPGSIMLVTNIVPRSIETTAGGGTARINVIDHDSQLLSGASVRLINSSSSVDVTRFTDSNGTALFSGAPAGSDYEVIVTGPIGGYQYSIDRTYFATTSNPNPVTVPFTILEGDISTLTFQIGRLADLSVKLLSGVVEDSYAEDFSDFTGVASSSGVEAVGGSLVLTNTAGVYTASGEAYLLPITPGSLAAWQAITIASEMPNNTSFRVRAFTGTGPYTVIPEVDLPGNTIGFNGTTIDISALDPTVYPEIVLGLSLETTNTATSATIRNIEVFYRESESPLVGQTTSIRGEKIVGTNVTLDPIYKFSTTTVTDGGGQIELTGLEFDRYQITLPGSYDLTAGCPGYPYVLEAGVDGTVELTIGSNEVHSLRLSVIDQANQPVPGATAVLTRSGYNETRRTGGCGQVFYPGAATAQVDYVLTVNAEGYQSFTMSDITIDGDVFMTVTLVAD